MDGVAPRLTARQLQVLSRSPEVQFISLDAVVRATQSWGTGNPNSFVATIGADQVNTLGFTGKGITVAVFDSGVDEHSDLSNRIAGWVKFTNGVPESVHPKRRDEFGHGTHVGGIIAGNGSLSSKRYVGVAPQARLLSIQVLDETGQELTSRSDSVFWSDFAGDSN